jgi:hypothetical protein
VESLVNEHEYRFILLSVLLSTVTLLLSLSFWLEGVYERRFLNIIESWFLLGLNIMVALAVSIADDDISKAWFSCCIAIFFVSFLAILVYHVHMKLCAPCCIRKSITNVRRNPINQNYGTVNAQRISHSSFGIREHDSALDLLDPPTDEDYYYDSN